MRNLRITHVVNVTSEIPNHFERDGIISYVSYNKHIGITYLRVVVEDKNESKIHYYFPRVYGFIDSAIFGKPKEESKSHSDVCPLLSGSRVDAKYAVARKSFIAGMESLKELPDSAPEEHSPEEISQAFDRMIAGSANSNRVLVHCAMGISRSSAIVIMYLMKRFNLSLESVRPG